MPLEQQIGSRPTTAASLAETIRFGAPRQQSPSLFVPSQPGAPIRLDSENDDDPDNDHDDDDDDDLEADPDFDDRDLDPEQISASSPLYSTEALAPPGLKEISSLGAWTVSSAKPDFGVTALRSNRPDRFWQSDGPQPHTLSVHFFKLVSIVAMRVLMDFDTDESYTPTKIQFWAGTALHDLHEFATMELEQPRGWIDVDFSRVGKIPVSENTDGATGEKEDPETIDWATRPVLRAFLVQVRILENHQNGKDTHLRGFQVFARDESVAAGSGRSRRTKDAAAQLEHREVNGGQQQKARKIRGATGGGLPLPAWLHEPILR